MSVFMSAIFIQMLRLVLRSPSVLIPMILSSVVTVFVQTAFAQHKHYSTEPYYFSRISIERGLSQSSVYTITQDKQGFMWFGTQDGLNKFDGYTFSAIRASKQKSINIRTSFPNGWLSAVMCDIYGNIWTGMNGGGLVYMNRPNGSILVLTTDTLSEAIHRHSTLSSKFVTGLLSDAKGRIWIGTDKGLDVIEKPQKAYTTLTPPEITHISHPKLADGITALAADAVGNIWLAGASTLVRYSPLHHTFDEIPLPTSLLANSPAIQTLYLDKLGRVWAGTSANGIFLYNPISRQSRIIAHNIGNPSSLINNRIYAITTDTRGYLWVGTDGGVSILEHDISMLADEAALNFVHALHDTTRLRSLSDNAVRSLYCDSSGTVWVGTLIAGLSSWHPLRQRFELYSPETGNATFLPSRIVRAFYQENDSILWIGTDGGLSIWNRRRGTATIFNPDTHPEITSSRTWTITPDAERNHIVWIGTDGGGLYKYDKHIKRLQRFDHSNGLVNDRIRAAWLASDGNLWLGTMNGLSVFDTHSERFTRTFLHNPHDTTSLSNNRVQTIFQDTRGVIWAGTSLGLNRFNSAFGRWKRYYHVPNDSTTIPNDWIKHITQTRDGCLWISTITGVCVLDAERETFRSFGTAQGLVNDYVYGIVEDNDGLLWMGTDNGLAQFNRKTSSFRIFEAADGLQSNEFNTNAQYRNTAGELFFGGVNGFNIINSSRLVLREFMPSVVLTSLKILNTEYISNRDVSFIHDLVLDYQDNMIECSFAAPDYANSNRIRYTHWLEGSNTGWMPPSLRNFAMYTNLPPGKYTLHVRATNSDGVWSKKELSLNIIIKPPFWGTWWFRIALALTILATGFGGYRWRVRSIAARNELLEKEVRQRTALLQERTQQLEQSNQELSWANERLHELNIEKNAILGIAAHDMKTPLGTILTITELLEDKQHPPTNEEVHSFSSMIRQTAERMLGLVKQVLDMNMIEEGKLRLSTHEFDLRETLQKIVVDAQAAAIPKNIAVHCTALTEPMIVFADHIATIQCLENIMSNAVKYSPLGKQIWVETSTYIAEDGVMYRYISVRDEGQGLTEKDKQRLFTKFAKLSARPTGGEHSSGLGLSIVKKLMEAMNGEILCISEHGKGATFTLKLPVKAT